MSRGLHLLGRYWAELYAVFVGVVGVIDAIANPTGYEGVDKGPDWAVWLAPAAVAAPLLFRRRFPFGAPACSVVLAVVASFVTTGEAVTDGLGAVFIIAASAWLFGELDTRSAGLGLFLIYAAGTLVNLNSSDVVWGDYLFPAVLFTLFWAASRALAVRGQHLRDAQARAHHLAAERDAESQRAVAEERQRIARELEMLRYIARGLSNAEIAREAYVSETTVKTHVAHILGKLRLRDRVQAVVFAYENGVVTQGEGPVASR